MIETTACKQSCDQEIEVDELVVIAENQQFYDEVISGLTMQRKQLPSKYFYDAIGDQLFQDIMNCEDYYLTRCEMEIFSTQTKDLVRTILQDNQPFELIELGPGDCTKSIHLFKGLLDAEAHFHYIPIDISQNVIRNLETTLPEIAPGIMVSGLNGDYFQMLEQLKTNSGLHKVILCLGANIGNMTIEKSHEFCNDLRKYLAPGDLIIIGFDLIKNPVTIRTAYDDREGITRQFNLNLLRRINRELVADFNIDLFEHYCNYDPETGACKSYLVCQEDSEVHFPEHTIHFKKDEYIWMEISQKHTVEQINEMAIANGFQPFKYLTDSKNWFMDAIWIAD